MHFHVIRTRSTSTTYHKGPEQDTIITQQVRLVSKPYEGDFQTRHVSCMDDSYKIEENFSITAGPNMEMESFKRQYPNIEKRVVSKLPDTYFKAEQLAKVVGVILQECLATAGSSCRLKSQSEEVSECADHNDSQVPVLRT